MVLAVIEAVYRFLWGDLFTIPIGNGNGIGIPLLVLLLIPTGIYFTIRTKFPQVRLFRSACKAVMEKPDDEDAVSSFQALMVSTASRVGTGNIVGVSSAICIGGFGAVFWMWVIAIIGSASAFVESTLAQIYKKKGEDGTCYGGPAYYIVLHFGADRWQLHSVLP